MNAPSLIPSNIDASSIDEEIWQRHCAESFSSALIEKGTSITFLEKSLTKNNSSFDATAVFDSVDFAARIFFLKRWYFKDLPDEVFYDHLDSSEHLLSSYNASVLPVSVFDDIMSRNEKNQTPLWFSKEMHNLLSSYVIHPEVEECFNNKKTELEKYVLKIIPGEDNRYVDLHPHQTDAFLFALDTYLTSPEEVTIPTFGKYLGPAAAQILSLIKNDVFREQRLPHIDWDMVTQKEERNISNFSPLYTPNHL